MKKKKILIEVSVEKELPKADETVIVIGQRRNLYSGEWQPFIDYCDNLPQRLHDNKQQLPFNQNTDEKTWLKEQELYVFTKEELEKAITNAFNNGFAEGGLTRHATDRKYYLEKFISSLNLK